MSESVLNREFKEGDIQRIRNLVRKKYGESTIIQGGYENHTKDYKEGEIFEENGKKWVILNGLKQSVTKHDTLKKIFQFPLICPKCTKPMGKTDINKKMFSLHGVCLDCVIYHETQLKIKGLYKEYENKALKQNKNEILEDLSKAITEWSRSADSNYISEDGDVQHWDGGVDKKKVAKDLNQEIDKIKSNGI